MPLSIRLLSAACLFALTTLAGCQQATPTAAPMNETMATTPAAPASAAPASGTAAVNAEEGPEPDLNAGSQWMDYRSATGEHISVRFSLDKVDREIVEVRSSGNQVLVLTSSGEQDGDLLYANGGGAERVTLLSKGGGGTLAITRNGTTTLYQ